MVGRARRVRCVLCCGYLLLDPASGTTAALVEAFAAVALLAMLADTLLPDVSRAVPGESP